MAKVHNVSDKTQKVGPHQIDSQESKDIPDQELAQHKQDPATKRLFDSGDLKEEGSTGQTAQFGGTPPGKK